MRNLALMTTMMVIAALGCSGDDTGDAGSGGSAGATGGTGGSGGVGATGGMAGSAGSAGSTGGTGATGGTGGGSDDAGSMVDAGHDAGPQPTRCVAPVPNPSPGNTCPAPGTMPSIKATQIAMGLTRPIFVTAAPGDATRLFVVEREGQIKIIDRTNGNQVLGTAFIDVPMVLSSGVGSDGGEQGLLGMAFHPDYPTDPRFFVDYVNSSGDEVVRSFEVSAADPNVADTSKGGPIVTIDDMEGNHNGGMIAFGPDGCLYVGSGDGGGADDTHSSNQLAPFPGNGQNLDTTSGNLNPLLGKILRFDVDAPTTGAPGNLSGASVPHIWDYGIRNPWRFSFDRQTGDLYIGDVGQGTREEVDVEPAGTGKLNYGWKITEGTICRPGGPGSCDMTGLTPPVDEYPHGGGDDCIVGGYVYRGSAIPSLQGFYLFADNGSSQNVRAFVWDGTGRCNDETVMLTSQLTISGDITSFGEDSSGELYITSFGPNGTDGRVYRIDMN